MTGMDGDRQSDGMTRPVTITDSQGGTRECLGSVEGVACLSAVLEAAEEPVEEVA